MFYIRADANKEIATGHIMRCLSIAGELREHNVDTAFITADHQADEIIHARGYQTICLNSQWSNLETEISKIKELIAQKSIEKLLVDTYYATDKYLEELSKVTKVIYIDDLGKLKYPVDKIVNYNIYGSEIDYCRLTGCQQSSLLLGPKYAPLRREFQNIEPIFRENIKSVFVSTGGADSYNIAGTFLEKIALKEEYEAIDFHVISGKLNTNFEKLVALAEKASNIYIHSNVLHMSEIMCGCDIAISGCGSTMYELCRCGLPVITFSFADNQKPGAGAFDKEKVAIDCGDARDGLETLINAIELAMIELIQNSELRKSMYKSAVSLVDGQGVKRLAEEILKI